MRWYGLVLTAVKQGKGGIHSARVADPTGPTSLKGSQCRPSISERAQLSSRPFSP